MDKLFICTICGHIEFGSAPANCPVCAATTFIEDPNAIMATEKEGKEKHVPVLVYSATCGLIPNECKDVFIKVGSVPHPMQADHWIMWIDVYVNNQFASRVHLTPQTLQAATCVHFKKDVKGTVTVIENCNKHGKWMAKIAV